MAYGIGGRRGKGNAVARSLLVSFRGCPVMVAVWWAALNCSRRAKCLTERTSAPSRCSSTAAVLDSVTPAQAVDAHNLRCPLVGQLGPRTRARFSTNANCHHACMVMTAAAAPRWKATSMASSGVSSPAAQAPAISLYECPTTHFACTSQPGRSASIASCSAVRSSSKNLGRQRCSGRRLATSSSI